MVILIISKLSAQYLHNIKYLYRMKAGLSINEIGKIKPYKLALLIMLGTLLCISFFGLVSNDDEIEWAIAIYGLGLFAWLNAVLGFFNPSWGSYVMQSILCYIGLMFVHLGIAYLISTTGFFDTPTYQMMLTATTMFFGVAIFMSKFIKGLTEFFHKI